MSAHLSTIPNAIHLCPECGDLAEGPELCPQCQRANFLLAQLHAARANELYGRLQRVSGAMPEEERRRPLSGALIVLSALLAFYVGAYEILRHIF